MSDCKKIKEELSCKDRTDCLWNKSKKCQQKPKRYTKKSKESYSSSELLDSSMKGPTTMTSTPRSSEESVSTGSSLSSPKESVSSPCIIPLESIVLEDPTEEYLRQLNEKMKKCDEECKQIAKEIHDLEEFRLKSSIENITLDKNQKLIDLLIERVLDTDPNWEDNLHTLINIPHGLKGEVLRGGDYFEALFQLAIAINILPMFNNRKIRFKDIKGYKEIRDFPNYLYEKPIQNSGGGEQGISDITIQVEDGDETPSYKEYSCGHPPKRPPVANPHYFISVKGFKKEKSVKDYYDLSILDQQLKLFPEIEHKYVVVCVKNKQQFMTKLDRSRIEFLKNSLHNVVGYEEIIDAFKQFRLTIFRRIGCSVVSDQEGRMEQRKRIEHEIRTLFPKNDYYKQPLKLYFHQELIVESVKRRINEVQATTKRHFLCIGVLPRGGKSYIAGGIILNHKRIMKPTGRYNVLFLTSAVNETRGQFKNDLIEKFADFSDFDFIDVVKAGPSSDDSRNKFYFMSRELSSMSVKPEGEEEDNDEIVKDMFSILEGKLGKLPEIDIIFFDEAHIGIKSKTVRSNFQKGFEKFGSPAPVILMTATYKKPSVFLDSPDDLFVWDLQDIKDMTMLPVLKLDGFIKSNPDVFIRYPEEGLRILSERIHMGESLESLAKPYIQFPKPNFINLTLTPNTIQHLKDIGAGYNFIKAFELDVDEARLVNPAEYLQWGGMLRNREHALRIRQFLTPEQDIGNPDELAYPFLQNTERKYRALNQIFSIAQKNGSRPIAGQPFSILMFLPFGYEKQTTIGQLCRVWASFMLQSKYWRENFVFLTLSTYDNHIRTPGMTYERAVEKGLCHREDFKDDLKEIIIQVEKEALKQGKGLVILSGDVAKMGISLKCVDVVFLMSNTTDADDIIQKMYRALTDDAPYKKDGFIVDLDLKRCVRAVFDYDLEKDKLRSNIKECLKVEERLHRVWELCNWGQDAFIEENTDMDFNDIMDEIKGRVFEGLERDIFDSVHKEDFMDRQVSIIMDDVVLFEEIQSLLRGARYSKQKDPVKDALEYQAGPNLPDETNPAPAMGDPPSSSHDVSSSSSMSEALLPPQMTSTELKDKVGPIITTFVNALVLKSSDMWTDTLNMVSLLEKYYMDKEKTLNISTASCGCRNTRECLATHNNLYETAFCELTSYAFEQVGTSTNRGPQTYRAKYNKVLHTKIMEMVENIFNKSTFLTEWNIYIEILLREIKDARKFGGTRKKYRQNIRNVTRKKPQCIRNY